MLFASGGIFGALYNPLCQGWDNRHKERQSVWAKGSTCRRQGMAEVDNSNKYTAPMASAMRGRMFQEHRRWGRKTKDTSPCGRG